MNTVTTRKSNAFALTTAVVALILNTAPGAIRDRPAGPRADAHHRPASAPPRGFHPCTGKMGVPIGLSVSAPEAAISAGAQVRLTAAVNAETDLGPIRLAIQTEGPVQLEGPASIKLPALLHGQSHSIEIPVRYTGDGNGAVHVQLTADAAGGGERFGRRETFYTRLNNGRARANQSGFPFLEFREAQEEFQAGRMTADEFTAVCRRLQTLDAVSQSILVEPAPGARTPPGADLEFQPAAAATITVRGSVMWQDENGTLHPAYGMTVQLWDAELIGAELVAQMVTGVDGQYSFVVDNNDGPGEGGRDNFVRIRTSNAAVSIEQPGMGPYERDGGTTATLGDGGIFQQDFICQNNTATGPACSVLTAATYAAAYAASLNGGPFLPQLHIEWPGAQSTSLFDGSRIHLLMLDRWDWDVLFHEFGHYVMDTFNIDNSPGGDHSSATCLSDVRMSKDVGIRLAWGEGWPTYFGTAAQARFGLASLNVPRVGDVNYNDTEDITINYSLESQADGRSGEDNETAISRILWDLFDTASDSRDNISVSDQTLFDRINTADPDNLSQAWAALRSGLSAAADLAFGAVAADHGVGPQLIGPANNGVARPGTPFSWNPGAGCNPMTFGGTSFELVFFHPVTLARILTLPGLATANHTLTLAEYQNLVAGTRQVRFAVEARNLAGPATGPYLGDNFLAILNRPPTANAGPDQLNVECTSPAGALVMLNGAGSSDPDGDLLTYSWSAPGITFNNPASPTPSATFPNGAPIVVTLTVSDGIETATDTVSIRVVDTTPPVITVHVTPDLLWPPNHKLVDIRATVAVSDICDPNPTFVLTSITVNEPDNDLGDGNTKTDVQQAAFGTPDTMFQLRAERGGLRKGRVYTILYTARDMSGNPANATARVTVAHDQR